MANDAGGKWIGLGVGDVDDPNTPRTAPNWDAITLLTGKLHDKYQWARDLGITARSSYDVLTAQVVEQFCGRVQLPVIRDPNGYAVANLAMRTRLGSYPPPPAPTHAALTVRGTGGVVGQDYTSLIAQASPVHHEVPMLYDASMGGIPVGAATDPNAPSGDECAQQLYNMLAAWFAANTGSASLFGYSLGTLGIVMFLNDVYTDGHPFAAYRDRIVCVVLIGDPWRPAGHTFYLGPDPGGQGIGSPYRTLSPAAIAALGWRICWLANPTDMYTNSPKGATGQVLADVEQIVLGTAISDPLGTIERAIPYLLRLVEKDGGLNTIFSAPAPAGGGLLGSVLGGLNVGSILTDIAGGSLVLTPGLVGLLLPVLESGFTGLLDGITTNGVELPVGIAADVQAALLALKFYGGGIHGHVSYHDTPWGVGPQTYLELGIQHANDWGSRIPVLV